jgi:hypothetical protein
MLSAHYTANHGGDKHRAQVDVALKVEEPTPATLATKVIATVTVRDFCEVVNGFDAPWGGTVEVDLAKLIREKLEDATKYNSFARDYLRDVEVRLPSVRIPAKN